MTDNEAPVTITMMVKNMATAELEGFRQSLQNLGGEAMKLLNSQLTQALGLAAIFEGLHKAFEATDELEQSQRVLAATAQIANVKLSDLYDISNNLTSQFYLTGAEANNFTTAITRLTIEAGAFNETQKATIAFLNLGAARGFTLEETSRALENAYVGVYRTAQRLIGQNLPNLFKEQAVAMGLTVQQLTASERAHILLNAALEAGDTARGSYQKWLETVQGQTQIMNFRINEAELRLGGALRPTRLLAIEGFGFLAEKLAEAIGGIQLLSSDLGAFAANGPARFKEFKAFFMDILADILDIIKATFPMFGRLIPEGMAQGLRVGAEKLKEEAKRLRASMKGVVDEANAEILAGMNTAPSTGNKPQGPPKPVDMTPDIRQVMAFNQEIEELKSELRDGSISELQFAGAMDSIRDSAKDALKTPGLSQEAWKGLQGVINSTTGEISNAAKGLFHLMDIALEMEVAWNKLINVTIKWRDILTDAAKNALNEFGNIVEQTFNNLVTHSQKAGIAFAKAVLGSIAAVVRGIGQMLLVQAGQWVAEGIANPAIASIKFAAAAKAAAVAGLAFAVAGTLGGASSALGGSGGGGGAGGGGGTGAVSATGAQNAVNQEATLVIEGSFLDMNDPRQADALAKALEQLSGRRVTVVARG